MSEDLITKIGFIGAGKMATAIIQGLLARSFIKPPNIFVSDVSSTQLSNVTSKYQISKCPSNTDVAGHSDAIIVAVKPIDFPHVLKEIKTTVSNKKTLISLAGGLKIETIESQLQQGARVIRTMPNVCAAVGESVTAIAAGSNATKFDVNITEKIFDCVGITMSIKESLFDAFTGIAGCGPAFMFQIIEALADAGVLLGINRKIAIQLAAQMMTGSGKLALVSGQHPGELKDSVCSPGGTTIEGVKVLEEKAIRAAFINAVVAACEKGQRIAAAATKS